ncbi:hypothetical protein BH09PLA1_BH09PLA1_25770 [soil metagenome]
MKAIGPRWLTALQLLLRCTDVLLFDPEESDLVCKPKDGARRRRKSALMNRGDGSIKVLGFDPPYVYPRANYVPRSAQSLTCGNGHSAAAIALVVDLRCVRLHGIVDRGGDRDGPAMGLRGVEC